MGSDNPRDYESQNLSSIAIMDSCRGDSLKGDPGLRPENTTSPLLPFGKGKGTKAWVACCGLLPVEGGCCL